MPFRATLQLHIKYTFNSANLTLLRILHFTTGGFIHTHTLYYSAVPYCRHFRSILTTLLVLIISQFFCHLGLTSEVALNSLSQFSTTHGLHLQHFYSLSVLQLNYTSTTRLVIPIHVPYTAFLRMQHEFSRMLGYRTLHHIFNFAL